jgi:hypothetical protein
MDQEEPQISQIESDVINEILSMRELQPSSKVDLSKLKYNSHYRSNEFWASKFPEGYSDIPQMKVVINSICEKNKNASPLDEITERIRISER